MKIKGKISWSKPAEQVVDKEGRQLTNQYDEPLMKRRLGINGDYVSEDGNMVRERFVAETNKALSDSEIAHWMMNNTELVFTLHFDDRELSTGHHFMNCYLSDINPA